MMFALLLLATTAAAWTATPRNDATGIFTSRFSRRILLPSVSVGLRARIVDVGESTPFDDDEKKLGKGASSSTSASVSASSSIIPSSRRQWLRDAMGSSAATACSAAALLRPASANAAASASAAPLVVSTAATCDPTVSCWTRDNRLVYILGTAHISSASADLAGQLVKDAHPDAVFVELDLKRVGSLSSPSLPYSAKEQQQQLSGGDDTQPPAKKSKIIIPAASTAVTVDTSKAVVEAKGTTSGSLVADDTSSSQPPARRFGGDAVGFGANIIGKALRGMYKNLDQAGFKPGEEFIMAVKEGQAIGADIVLGDRDVEVTLRRLTQALAVTDINKLMNPDSELEQSLRELIPSADPAMPTDDPAAYKQELSTFVESIKTREKVRKIMAELKELAPALVQAMLTERDAYMAAGLDSKSLLRSFSLLILISFFVTLGVCLLPSDDVLLVAPQRSTSTP